MISAFIASYGYLAVFVGTLLEGETILIAAGYAAHRGLFDWPLVVLVAFLGATAGDQLAFLLGRWKGKALIRRYPVLAARQQRIHHLLERYDVLFILSIRFLYGLRIAGPVILGSSKVSMLRFAALNAVGAAIWAVAIAGAGYTFGAAIGAVFVNVRRIEEAVLVGILVAGFAIWIWRHLGTRTRKP